MILIYFISLFLFPFYPKRSVFHCLPIRNVLKIPENTLPQLYQPDTCKADGINDNIKETTHSGTWTWAAATVADLHVEISPEEKTLVNVICAQIYMNSQMWFSATMTFAVCIWSIIQCLWIKRVKKKLIKITQINKILSALNVDEDEAELFVMTGIFPNSLAADHQERGQLQRYQLSVCDIHIWYIRNTLLNSVIALILLFVFVPYWTKFDNLFFCDISDMHFSKVLLKNEIKKYLCLVIDASILQMITYSLVISLVFIGSFHVYTYVVSITRIDNIVLSLYHGVTDTK